LPQLCTVCSHDHSHEINVALVNNGGNRRIATQYGLSEAAVRRHRAEHIPQLLVEARHAKKAAEANDLLARVMFMVEKLEVWLDRAEKAYEYREVRAFAGEWRQQVELLAKLAGQLQQEGTTNIHLSAEWLQIEAVIVSALDPYPEAQSALVRALSEVEHVHHN
jgi:hypothetical protein